MQSVEGESCFCFLFSLLAAHSKMQDERDKLRVKLNMETEQDNLGISPPTQMAKDAKLKGLIIRKECSQGKAKALLNFLLITLKNQKLRVFSHTNVFEEIVI